MSQRVHTPADVDLTNVDIQQCPYPAYAVLRQQAPVFADPGTGYLVVTRYEDLRSVLKDPETFSSQIGDPRYRDLRGRRQLDSEHACRIRALYEEKGWLPKPALAGRDDPNHKQMRAMFDEAFRPARVKDIEPFVEATAYELIDAFIDAGECEWVAQFAVPLPLIVIGKQMGARKEDLAQIKVWTDAFFRRIGMMLSEEEELDAVELEIQAQHYFQPIFERLRQEPDDSLLSVLVNRVIDGWGRLLNDEELHAEMMSDTFVGGSETTTNALSAGVKLLIENPDVWERLKADPDTHLKTFIEEVLRLESPVQGLNRIATRDTELSGVAIPKGSVLNLRFAAANRDERQFECPERLDLDRKKAATHLAFGSGTHHCLGAPLARRELYWGFKALVDRIDSLRFASEQQDFAYHPHVLLRSLKSLHIEFTPRSR